jgi:hypothetical protein
MVAGLGGSDGQRRTGPAVQVMADARVSRMRTATARPYRGDDTATLEAGSPAGVDVLEVAARWSPDHCPWRCRATWSRTGCRRGPSRGSLASSRR